MRTPPQLAATAATLLVSALLSAAWARDTHQLIVNCSRGQTIAEALARGDPRKPMVLTIRGTCRENVAIDRDDVTILGEDQATISPSAADRPAISIAATRVRIDHLTVTGGTTGIVVAHASDVVVDKSVIQSAAQSGINLIASHARVLNSTIKNNGSDGVHLLQATAFLSKNEILSNGRSGVYLEGKSALQASENTISSNRSNGVAIYDDSFGKLISNELVANGNPPDNRASAGVHVSFARVSLETNSIRNHFGPGVLSDASSVGAASNTITGNGWGLYLYLGSTLVLGADTVSGNQSDGVVLNTNCTAQIGTATIANNGNSGVLLTFGSKLIVPLLVPTIGGNGGYGLKCTDADSSWGGGQPNFSPPNALGAVSPACTGF